MWGRAIAPCRAKCSMGLAEGCRVSRSGGFTSNPGFILSRSSRSLRFLSSRSLRLGSALYRPGMW